MKMILELPEEFRKHFNRDKFQDSFMRICGDINEICKSHCNPCSESLGLSGNLEKELVDVIKESFKNAITSKQEQEGYKTVFFFKMISEHEYSSACELIENRSIENFASKITFFHVENRFWKLVKDGKTIAREAIYLGE